MDLAACEEQVKVGRECSLLAPSRRSFYAVAIVDPAVVQGMTINQITQFAGEREKGKGCIKEICPGCGSWRKTG